MYCNVLYSNVLYCTVLYRTNVILFAIRSTCSPHLKITDLFIIVQYSTVHYSTVQYSTVHLVNIHKSKLLYQLFLSVTHFHIYSVIQLSIITVVINRSVNHKFRIRPSIYCTVL